jgi:hypothetical protein
VKTLHESTNNDLSFSVSGSATIQGSGYSTTSTCGSLVPSVKLVNTQQGRTRAIAAHTVQVDPCNAALSFSRRGHPSSRSNREGGGVCSKNQSQKGRHVATIGQPHGWDDASRMWPCSQLGTPGETQAHAPIWVPCHGHAVSGVCPSGRQRPQGGMMTSPPRRRRIQSRNSDTGGSTAQAASPDVHSRA